MYVEGRLKTRKWTDKDGAEKYTTEIIAQELTMLGGRQNGAGPRDAAGGEEGGYGEQQPRGEAPRRAAPPPRAPAPAPRAPAVKSCTGFDDMGDDIPFCSRLLAVGIQRRRPAWAAGRSALKI